MIEEFYTQYFSDIATVHPDIQHDPENENEHFWELVDVDALSDLNKALREKLQFPALILRPFTDEPNYENDNPVQMLSGAFTILMKVENRSENDIRQGTSSGTPDCRFDSGPDAQNALPGGTLNAQKIHLLRTFPGSNEPVVAGIATGWTYEFDWRLPVDLGNPTW